MVHRHRSSSSPAPLYSLPYTRLLSGLWDMGLPLRGLNKMSMSLMLSGPERRTIPMAATWEPVAMAAIVSDIAQTSIISNSSRGLCITASGAEALPKP